MIHKKNTNSVRGYTLLEMGLVLFIILLIMGIGVPMISSLFAEERLRQPANQLQLYARTARRLSITESRPYQIKFLPDRFVLEPYVTTKQEKEEIVESYKIASTTTYALQRRSDKAFAKLKLSGDSWVFQPDGICEPMRVHFQSKDGWIEFAFNPLTARPQDESYSFQ